MANDGQSLTKLSVWQTDRQTDWQAQPDTATHILFFLCWLLDSASLRHQIGAVQCGELIQTAIKNNLLVPSSLRFFIVISFVEIWIFDSGFHKITHLTVSFYWTLFVFDIIFYMYVCLYSYNVAKMSDKKEIPITTGVL